MRRPWLTGQDGCAAAESDTSPHPSKSQTRAAEKAPTARFESVGLDPTSAAIAAASSSSSSSSLSSTTTTTTATATKTTPQQPPDLQSIIRKLQRQGLRLRSTSPSSPPEPPNPDHDVFMDSPPAKTDPEPSELSTTALLPQWVRDEDLHLYLDISPRPGTQGFVEYDVRSREPALAPSPNTPSAAAAAFTQNTVQDDDRGGDGSSTSGGGLSDGLQAIMRRASMRASLPRLAAGVNRKDLVRFNISPGVGGHVSSRVINRVYKRPRMRVREKNRPGNSDSSASAQDAGHS